MTVDELIKKLEDIRSNTGNVNIEIVLSDNVGGYVTTKDFNVHADSDIDGCSIVSIEDNNLYM